MSVCEHFYSLHDENKTPKSGIKIFKLQEEELQVFEFLLIISLSIFV